MVSFKVCHGLVLESLVNPQIFAKRDERRLSPPLSASFPAPPLLLSKAAPLVFTLAAPPATGSLISTMLSQPDTATTSPVAPLVSFTAMLRLL